VEVGYNISKYLTKLATFEVGIYANINADYNGMTEEMGTMIAKRLPQLEILSIRNNYRNNGVLLRLQQRLKKLLPERPIMTE
jgi:hypothetical protein